MGDRSEYMRAYREENRDKINSRNRENYRNSEEVRKRHSIANKKHYRMNREKWQQYRANKIRQAERKVRDHLKDGGGP